MLALQKIMNHKTIVLMIFKIIVQTNEALKHYQSKMKVECEKKTEKEKKIVDIQETHIQQK